MLPNDTTVPDRNPVPLTVNVNAALPAATLGGAMLVITGPGVVIVRVTAFDTALPGFIAEICAVPGCAIKLAETAAVT